LADAVNIRVASVTADAAAASNVREMVSLASRVLGSNGHDDFVWGHASARDPEGRGAWMKVSGRGLTEIGARDVILVGADGEVVVGEGPPHVEYPIHTEILAARPDVGAVVHSHPPHAIALAAAGDTLRPVSHGGALFVPPDVPCFTKTSDLIVSRELGRAVAGALGEHQAMFLVNHGIVTVGADLPTAVVRAIVLERACHQQLLTRSFGMKLRYSDDDEARAKRDSVWHEQAIGSVWDHLVRLLA
jgi:L-fuculose-phosphate aldolase